MAKNIVICCDGTGNEFGDSNSNVVKLYSALLIDGRRQIGYYHPGVGTMGAPTAHNKFTKAWSVIMGLAFGAGLLANVGDAYRYLMNVYEDGDNIFLFGFSRGAYTVRVLGGILHMFGLLHPGNDGLIPYIIRLYARTSREAQRHDPYLRRGAGLQGNFLPRLHAALCGRLGHGELRRLDLGPGLVAVHRAKSGNRQRPARDFNRRATLLFSRQALGRGAAGTKYEASMVRGRTFGRGRLLPRFAERLIADCAGVDALRSRVIRIIG